MKHYLIPKNSKVTIFWFVTELEEEVNIDILLDRDWIVKENEFGKYSNRYIYTISHDIAIELYLDNCVFFESEEIKP